MYEILAWKSLKHPDGVERLLQYLCSELELLEHLRIFRIFFEFYANFKRTKCMEFTADDSIFRIQYQCLKEVNAHWKESFRSIGFWTGPTLARS